MLSKMLRAASYGATDPYFENVTLLLHGDGTNGAQNNTFTDGSTNNFTITRNGNTTQGTFSPYGDLWSNYFDGTGDYLSIANNAALNLSSGNFTLEAFVWWNGSNAYAVLLNKDGVFNGTYPSYSMSLNGSGYIRTDVGSGDGISSIQTITSNTLFPTSQWVHVAFVKNGTTLTLYQNGVSVASATQTATIIDGGKSLLIGWASGQPSNRYWDGYIAGARIVKGTAVYTAAFTPPTAPLTAITNTSLLTCQSNRFIDNSSNAFAITLNGDVKVTKFSPFNPSVAYSTGVTGGSAYFDGSGDSVSAPSNTIWTWANKSAWTFEAWIYPITIASVQPIYASFGGNTNNGELYLNTSGNLVFRYWIGSQVLVTSSGTVNAQSWNHVAFVYDGTNISLYINGSRQANVARQSPADTSTNAIYVGTTSLGHSGTTQLYFTGYITDARVVNGSAVYTGTSFTPPTAPLTAITNTSLLLNFTNAGIIDNAMMNDLETVGNAQISTTQKKFGTGALYFDGTGDYFSIPYISKESGGLIKPWGSGSYTLECWIYFVSVAAGQHIMVGYTSSSQVLDYAIYTAGIGTLNYYLSSNGSTWNLASGVSVGAISTNQWYHFAFVKNGNTWTPYLNGVAGTSTTTATAVIENTLPFTVGGRPTDSTNCFNGYIDDLRITKGVARYTANFTPPSRAFSNR